MVAELPGWIRAVGRDHVGGDHGQAGRDLPGMQAVHPDHARRARIHSRTAGSERPRGAQGHDRHAQHDGQVAPVAADGGLAGGRCGRRVRR